MDSISPIDGRYNKYLKEFNSLFSESALIKHRIKVELLWFEKLTNIKL